MVKSIISRNVFIFNQEFHVFTKLKEAVTLLTEEPESELYENIPPTEKFIGNEKYEFFLSSNYLKSYEVELKAKLLSEKLKKIDDELNKDIKNWLNNVYHRGIKMNVDVLRTENWFERIFTFIKVGELTEFEEVRDLFKMSHNLYHKFDSYYKSNFNE